MVVFLPIVVVWHNPQPLCDDGVHNPKLQRRRVALSEPLALHLILVLPYKYYSIFTLSVRHMTVDFLVLRATKS